MLPCRVQQLAVAVRRRYARLHRQPLLRRVRALPATEPASPANLAAASLAASGASATAVADAAACGRRALHGAGMLGGVQ